MPFGDAVTAGMNVTFPWVRDSLPACDSHRIRFGALQNPKHGRDCEETCFAQTSGFRKSGAGDHAPSARLHCAFIFERRLLL